MEKKSVQNNEWTFVAVHKSRVKPLENAILVNGTSPKLKDKVEFSTLFPKVFKRAKEHDDAMFFSFPKDFEVKVRKTNFETNTYSEIYLNEEQKEKFFKGLRTDING